MQDPYLMKLAKYVAASTVLLGFLRELWVPADPLNDGGPDTPLVRQNPMFHLAQSVCYAHLFAMLCGIDVSNFSSHSLGDNFHLSDWTSACVHRLQARHLPPCGQVCNVWRCSSDSHCGIYYAYHERCLGKWFFVEVLLCIDRVVDHLVATFHQ